MSVEADVATYLAAQNLGSGTRDAHTWLISYSQLRDTTQPQMAVLASPSLPEQIAHDQVGARRPGIQVLVTGGLGAYAAGYVKVQEIYNLLTPGPHTMNGNTIHVDSRLEPIWLGYTEQDHRPRWSLNFQLTITSTTL